MSASESSSAIETIFPSRLTCEYQPSSPLPRTVSAARGSRRMYPSRSLVSSMFRSTRPSSQSYQVGTLCGEPSGRSVATTAGFGRRRNSSTSGGTGTLGTSARALEDADVHVLALVDYLTKLPACALRELG